MSMGRGACTFEKLTTQWSFDESYKPVNVVEYLVCVKIKFRMEFDGRSIPEETYSAITTPHFKPSKAGVVAFEVKMLESYHEEGLRASSVTVMGWSKYED